MGYQEVEVCISGEQMIHSLEATGLTMLRRYSTKE